MLLVDDLRRNGLADSLHPIPDIEINALNGICDNSGSERVTLTTNANDAITMNEAHIALDISLFKSDTMNVITGKWRSPKPIKATYNIHESLARFYLMKIAYFGH